MIRMWRAVGRAGDAVSAWAWKRWGALDTAARLRAFPIGSRVRFVSGCPCGADALREGFEFGTVTGLDSMDVDYAIKKPDGRHTWCCRKGIERAQVCS